MVYSISACRRSADSSVESRRRAYAVIDDSIKAQSPHVRDMIYDGMDNASDSMTYYEYYVRMGKYFCLSETPDSLVPYIDGTIRFALCQPVSPRRNSLLAFAYNCQAANYHNFHKKPDDVIGLYHKAYDLSLSSETKDQTPMVCANLGDAYLFKNSLPEAAAWYRRALFLVDSLQLPEKENITLYLGLATIYLHLDDFDSSLKYYRQSEKHFGDMPLAMQSYYLNNYGNYYYYAKDYKASLDKFLELKTLLERHNKLNTFDMHLCKLNLADVYLNLGDVEMSEKYLDEVDTVFTVTGDTEAAYYVNTIRIGQAVRRGDMNRVAGILASEKKVDNISFNIRNIRDVYLRKYYVARGDYRSAYENLRVNVAMNDSMEHNRQGMRASEIMERFSRDTLQLHHNVIMEHKNAEIQSTYTLAAVIVGALTTLCLLLAVGVLYSRKRYLQGKMRIMQLRLDGARNRVSPHFVFNVLNNSMLKNSGGDNSELLMLSKLIRANLDMTCRQTVTLGEELDFVRRYVDIERKIYDGGFEYYEEVAVDIDKDAVMIPPMFVQILVENAIVHGLKNSDGDKFIRVAVTRTGGVLHIVVRDSGKGFDITCAGNRRTGLSIISQTIAIINERNKSKMRFSLSNVQDADGKMGGCEVKIDIPENIKFMS